VYDEPCSCSAGLQAIVSAHDALIHVAVTVDSDTQELGKERRAHSSLKAKVHNSSCSRLEAATSLGERVSGCLEHFFDGADRRLDGVSARVEACQRAVGFTISRLQAHLSASVAAADTAASELASTQQLLDQALASIATQAKALGHAQAHADTLERDLELCSSTKDTSERRCAELQAALAEALESLRRSDAAAVGAEGLKRAAEQEAARLQQALTVASGSLEKAQVIFCLALQSCIRDLDPRA
jgi:chromosome segregation ATPase